MAKYFTIIFIFSLPFLAIKAQKIPEYYEPQANYKDRYGPFHPIIKDTTQKIVKDFGHYFSVGFGSSNDHGVSAINMLSSYSLAYKSHLFSVTYAGATTLFYGGGQNEPYYKSHYIGFLVGESVRFRHALISLSTGIASSSIYLYYRDSNNSNNMITFQPQGIFSVPIEFKAFLLARSGGIGIGIHISKNILSPYEYSPFYFGISIVAGSWNKSTKGDY